MSAKTWKWTPERIETAIRILKRNSDLNSALAEISTALNMHVSRSGLDEMLGRNGHPTAFQHLQLKDHRRRSPGQAVAPPAPAPVSEPAEPEGSPYDRFSELLDIIKRYTKSGGLTLEGICDALGMSPKMAREFIDDAREAGISLDIVNDRLLFRPLDAAPAAPPVLVTPTTIPGTDHQIGVFSDMHFGSKYCLRKQFIEFVLYCYHAMGIRDFFCPGDVIEGCYRHAQFERTSESLDDQQEEFLDALPELPGMRIFFIDGNHDYTFFERTGVESGKNLVRLARERGRTDLFFFGSRGALVQYGDTKIEMWHPKKGKAYAISYQLQNKIRDTNPQRLPNILLCGHVHEYVKFIRSDVWAFYCGTFQHGDSAYGRSIGGDVAMGGLVIRWRIDEDGIVRVLSDSFIRADYQPKIWDVAVPAAT